MRRNQFHVEWKARDKITKHAWIVDTKENAEVPLCEPTRKLRYISKYHKAEYMAGKLCKDCKRKIAGFKLQFPFIHIMEDV